MVAAMKPWETKPIESGVGLRPAQTNNVTMTGTVASVVEECPISL